ncbi:hypothetical protein INT43_006132 [Umbelopsis isabellina]|uniref:Major facilitator superfamily (MFS) profile domain-containing protein n=1 Tax=Mortierella isabellina TaxID=91625 RepID=A0A8H7PZH8_MORIS|nr:hypothetical protein INT43_006132 [Umbelopsis isabellina]
MSDVSQESNLDVEKQDVAHLEGVKAQPTAADPNYKAKISKAEKKLLRKIDMRILPYLCAVGFFQFLDKMTLSYSSVLGIIQDTHLQGAEYGALGSIFYVGYLAMQVPNSFMMQRIPLAKLVGGIVFLWGGVIALTALGSNFQQLAGLRFLLGFLEACVNPNFILLTNTFYRKQEVASRIGAWWLVNGLCTAFGGLIGYGIGHMEGVAGLHAWQWIMIILGIVTSILGVVVFFFLLDDPRSPRFNFTEEEKMIMEERLRDNGIKRSNEVKWDQVKECFRDPKTYVWFFLAVLINMTNGALTTFSSLITVGLGFSGLNSILLQIPSGFMDAILILLGNWIHGRTGDTLYTCAGLMFVSELGLIFLAVLPGSVKLLGLYLVYGYAAAYVLFMSSIASNTNGYTKKIWTNAIVLVGYTVGNIIGPLIMTSNQAPEYIGGLVGCIGASFVAILLMIGVRFYMGRINKRKAVGTPKGQMGHSEEDITDVLDPNYVYRL